MYTHTIEKHKHNYTLTVYNTRGNPIYVEHNKTEKQCRDGLVRFMYRGPNVGTQAGIADDTDIGSTGKVAGDYTDYDLSDNEAVNYGILHE